MKRNLMTVLVVVFLTLISCGSLQITGTVSTSIKGDGFEATAVYTFSEKNELIVSIVKDGNIFDCGVLKASQSKENKVSVDLGAILEGEGSLTAEINGVKVQCKAKANFS